MFCRVFLFVCLFFCLFVCLFFCLFVCSFVCLFVCLFVRLFVFYQSFLPRKLTTHRTAEKERGREGNHILFYSTTSTRSRTFRHLFATFHVRWLSHIFNCTTCICQTATRWDLPPYRTTICLIDNAKLVFVCCLLNDLILGFLL